MIHEPVPSTVAKEDATEIAQEATLSAVTTEEAHETVSVTCCIAMTTLVYTF